MLSNEEIVERLGSNKHNSVYAYRQGREEERERIAEKIEERIADLEDNAQERVKEVAHEDMLEAAEGEDVMAQLHLNTLETMYELAIGDVREWVRDELEHQEESQ